MATGGNIDIEAGAVVLIENSDILAFSPDGRGGQIDLSQTTLFSSNLDLGAEGLSREALIALIENEQVDINASGGTAPGEISTNDASLIENSLTELPETLVNPDTLLTNSCIARSSDGQTGTLLLNESEYLPPSPSASLPTPYSLDTVEGTVAETRLPAPQRGSLSHLQQPQQQQFLSHRECIGWQMVVWSLVNPVSKKALFA